MRRNKMLDVYNDSIELLCVAIDKLLIEYGCGDDRLEGLLNEYTFKSISNRISITGYNVICKGCKGDYIFILTGATPEIKLINDIQTKLNMLWLLIIKREILIQSKNIGRKLNNDDILKLYYENVPVDEGSVLRDNYKKIGLNIPTRSELESMVGYSSMVLKKINEYTDKMILEDYKKLKEGY